MGIWVDADACPNVIKEVLWRAADRCQVMVTMVANQNLRVPPSKFVRAWRVESGFDVADNEIVRHCQPGETDSSLPLNSISGYWPAPGTFKSSCHHRQSRCRNRCRQACRNPYRSGWRSR